jgi:hypothetical protein
MRLSITAVRETRPFKQSARRGNRYHPAQFGFPIRDVAHDNSLSSGSRCVPRGEQRSCRLYPFRPKDIVAGRPALLIGPGWECSFRFGSIRPPACRYGLLWSLGFGKRPLKLAGRAPQQRDGIFRIADRDSMAVVMNLGQRVRELAACFGGRLRSRRLRSRRLRSRRFSERPARVASYPIHALIGDIDEQPFLVAIGVCAISGETERQKG